MENDNGLYVNNLYDIVKTILDYQHKTFSWLAENVDMSRQGLKAALNSGSIRVDKLMLIAEVLNIPSDFFLELPEVPLPLKDKIIYSSEYKRKVDDLTSVIQGLNKRINELEELVKEKQKMINLQDSMITLLQETGAVSSYNLTTPKEERHLSYPDLDDPEALLEQIRKNPNDFNDKKAMWEFIRKEAEKKLKQKKQ